MSTESVTSSTLESLTGRVKWFNNKAGYGFVTVSDGSRAGTDIFVHHSSINVSDQQYKYLVQGEYIQFSLVTTQSGPHEFQASNVSGIKGGKLMCETRHEFKTVRRNYKTGENESDSEPVKRPRPKSDAKTPRSNGEGPKESQPNTWNVVGEQNTKSKPRGRPARAKAPVSNSI